MRFKRESNVEVLNKKEVPSGCWCCAKIVCGNGHNYTVRYDGFEGAANEAHVEMVPRNVIRPCPPPLELSENLVPGDVIEVFDNFSWKVATISKILGKYFLVSLVGSSQEYKVGKLEMRVRQFWKDDKWVVIGGKGLSNHENAKRDEVLTLKHNRNSCLEAQKSEMLIASFHNLKRRSPYLNSVDEAYGGSAEKFRAVEKEGRCLRVISANLSIFSEKGDVCLPRNMRGGKDIRASLKNRKKNSDVDMERRKPSGDVGCCFADSVTCSVGSCSIGSNDSYKSPPSVSTCFTEDCDDRFSDAESICQLEYEEGNLLLPEKEELAAEIHRLELHAYRCTIGALHASGPLSWEQEELGQVEGLSPCFQVSKHDLGTCQLSLALDARLLILRQLLILLLSST